MAEPSDPVAKTAAAPAIATPPKEADLDVPTTREDREAIAASASEPLPGDTSGKDEGKLTPPEADVGATAPPAGSYTETAPPYEHDDDVNPPDFDGHVLTNNDIPSAQTLRKIDDYVVLDKHGKSHTFKSLYNGRHSARRVLLIFVRHFFCGNCQEYLRSLSASITTDALLRLPISTFIAVIGCGDPALIDMYATETKCPFPVYADPTRALYRELGMVSTWALGNRPAYMRKGMLQSMVASIVQGLKQVPSGLATKAGDQKQIGGEFLFEPIEVLTPTAEVDRRLSQASAAALGGAETRKTMAAADADAGAGAGAAGEGRKTSLASRAATDEEEDEAGPGEEKRVTWCHRMKTTRDHAEIPELMEVLGLDGQGRPVKDSKRWSRAIQERKGTRLSMAAQMSRMSISRTSESREK